MMRKTVYAVAVVMSWILAGIVLVGLAVDPKQAKALAAKCEIPEDQVLPFAKAVGSRVATLYLSGKFSTHAQQAAWAEGTGKGDLPAIVKQYQGRK